MTKIVFVLIIFLAAILRLYAITSNPPHLYWDEASISYNAYAINATGKDEWGVRYPLLFKSFGDNKLPFFVYLVVVFQRIIGPGDLAVRLPSALAGILTVVLMYFLIRELIFLTKRKFPETATCLLGMFFLAISPWHLQFSRAGFEANVAFLWRVAGVWLFLLAVRRNLNFLFLALICFVAAMYTYHSAALTAPLVLGLLCLLFAKKLFSNLKITIFAFLLALLLLWPYLPAYIFSAQGRIRFNAESVTNMPGNVMTNFINNYVSNFSFDFLFFKGDQNGRHSVKTLGELYLWQLPVVLVGIYFLIRFRSKASAIIFAWVLFAALPPSLTRVSPHALRNLLAVGGWQLLSTFGLIFLLSYLPKQIRFVIIIPIVIFSFLLYLHIYYVHYPKAFAADWQDGQRQAMEYLLKIQNDYDRIFVYEYADMSLIILKKDPLERDLMVAPSWMGTNLKVEPLREIRNSAGKSMFRLYEY
ncbi:glycosyltransferase family 39 protein [Candidatus Gottesmanbacteria bacterium]|nr:glycosyltransferase family 39 protein [Candidatus Gottesmanbacteria bacterium]